MTRLICWAALVVLACCARAPETGCAGWRGIRPAEATAVWLADHDREVLAGLIAHHETGSRLGCW